MYLLVDHRPCCTVTSIKIYLARILQGAITQRAGNGGRRAGKVRVTAMCILQCGLHATVRCVCFMDASESQEIANRFHPYVVSLGDVGTDLGGRSSQDVYGCSTSNRVHTVLPRFIFRTDVVLSQTPNMF